MDAAYLAWFQERSAWERDRDGPPVGFPALPDIPLGRYTDGEFFELEREHLFGKVWLYAAHDSELPETGSYKLCDIVGSPLVLVRGDDGRTLAPETRLSVVITDFLATGGDGIFDGVPGERPLEPGPPMRDVLATTLAARGGTLSSADPAIFDRDHPRLVFPGTLPLRCPTTTIASPSS